ncbi:AI-2E family transporter [Desulfolucanica intricata]|uniref:AI-2E family transporter n=1 Tax=Desulfolucanica intricata TaxID=1285191 RepID=UPI00082CB29A|nr:AI-2E family transporter [Desulfolucanica intricata]
MIWLRKIQTYRLFFLILLVLTGLYFLYLIRILFIPLLLAIVFSYLLNPLVTAMEKKGTSRVWAILIAYLAVFIILAAILMYGVPKLIQQLNKFVDTLPVYIHQVQSFIQAIQSRYAHLELPQGMRQIIQQRINWIEQTLLFMVSRIISGLIGLVSYIFYFLMAPIISFYILKDLELLKEKTEKLLPKRYASDILGLVREIDKVLSSFIRGYFTVCLIVGVLTGLAMALLGIEFALILGIIAGLTELIPYFGPVIGALPALVLAFLKSQWLVLKVIIVVLIIHQLEANIISPKILGDRVGLHPLTIIIVILAGGQLGGIMGLLIAVPVAAILKVFIIFAYKKLFLEYSS